jgi:hypothetical protein
VKAVARPFGFGASDRGIGAPGRGPSRRKRAVWICTFGSAAALLGRTNMDHVDPDEPVVPLRSERRSTARSTAAKGSLGRCSESVGRVCQPQGLRNEEVWENFGPFAWEVTQAIDLGVAVRAGKRGCVAIECVGGNWLIGSAGETPWSERRFGLGARFGSASLTDLT